MGAARNRFKLLLRRKPPFPGLRGLTLSSYTFEDDIPAGAEIAQIIGNTPGSTLYLLNNNHKFEIGGANPAWTLLKGAVATTEDVEQILIAEVHPQYGYRETPLPLNPQAPTADVYLGALTFIGYGAAHPQIYKGEKWVRLENGSGNAMTKLRANRLGQVVFASAGTNLSGINAVTATPRVPTDIADTYTFDLVEYEDSAFTTPTGETWPLTLHTRGTYTVPAVTVPVGNSGLFGEVPAKDIPLDKARFVIDWPAATHPRYLAGDTLSASSNNNQIRITQNVYDGKLLGEYLVLCPGGHNMPYVSATYPQGTVDFDIQPRAGVGNVTVNTLDKFVGEDLEDFTDANWYHITQIDPANTTMGYFKWSAGSGSLAFTKFHDMYIMRTRPSLLRDTGTMDLTTGSAQGCLWLNGSSRYICGENCIIDMDDTPALVNGVAAPRYANGFYAPNASGTINSQKIRLTNIKFGRCFYCSLATCKGSAYGDGFSFQFCENSGEHNADICHVSNFFNLDLSDGFYRDRRFYGGIHPDLYQIKMSDDSVAGVYPMGKGVNRNILIAGVDNPEASGQAAFFNQQAPNTWYSGGRVGDNFFQMHKQNGISPYRCDGLLIENNTLVHDITVDHSWVPPKPGKSGYINNADVTLIALNLSKNCIVRNNAVPSSTTGYNNQNDNTPSGVSNTGPDAATNIVVNNRGGVRQQEMGYNAAGELVPCVSAGPYPPLTCYKGPLIYGSRPATKAEAMQAYSALPGGPLDGTGTNGKCIGAFDTTGNYASQAA